MELLIILSLHIASIFFFCCHRLQVHTHTHFCVHSQLKRECEVSKNHFSNIAIYVWNASMYIGLLLKLVHSRLFVCGCISFIIYTRLLFYVYHKIWLIVVCVRPVTIFAMDLICTFLCVCSVRSPPALLLYPYFHNFSTLFSYFAHLCACVRIYCNAKRLLMRRCMET